MTFKKEFYKGVEYHFPTTFEDAETYLASIQASTISDSVINSMQWDAIRLKRDSLITATDWTQTLDCQLSDEKKSEFINYRQTLRNIPQFFDEPAAVVWPEEPKIMVRTK
ncbi:tail fiber assembly protein [uncultured Shewanella sp.]|uniref:tail fiber assembly protein n=1 Tax=uncultured Shewanella sp. TaxID=173975 RepID=UPI0026232D38|nr:tail fiber assembly protein [uncultured Shewanella sp.]